MEKILHINEFREGRAVCVCMYARACVNRVLNRECNERRAKRKVGGLNCFFFFETASLTADDCNIMERNENEI